MWTFGCAMIALILYWRWRNLYYTRLTQESRYEIYRLRDELRRSAIEGKVDSQSEMFDFIEYVLCKTAFQIDRFNIYTHTINAVLGAHKTPPEIASRGKQMFEAIQQNSDARRAMEGCQNVILSHLKQKHYFLGLLFLLGGFIKEVRSWMSKQQDSIVHAFTASPNSDVPYRDIEISGKTRQSVAC